MTITEFDRCIDYIDGVEHRLSNQISNIWKLQVSVAGGVVVLLLSIIGFLIAHPGHVTYHPDFPTETYNVGRN